MYMKLEYNIVLVHMIHFLKELPWIPEAIALNYMYKLLKTDIKVISLNSNSRKSNNDKTTGKEIVRPKSKKKTRFTPKMRVTAVHSDIIYITVQCIIMYMCEFGHYEFREKNSLAVTA